MATQFVERIAVETDGSGDDVLLIHGLGGTSNVWMPLMPSLMRHRTVRPDLPGSGRSARVEGPLTIDRFVQAMLRVCAALHVERAHVVAHSMGTIVAFHLANVAPQLVRSLALFGPLLAPPDPMPKLVTPAALRSKLSTAPKPKRLLNRAWLNRFISAALDVTPPAA